ncbi:MAG: hypothetical protein FD138_4695, partial [Planctomycetota bacterium]
MSRSGIANSRVAVLFLVGHEPLNHLVPRAGEAVQAADGDGSTQLVERQRGAENLDSFTQPRVVKTFRELTLGLHLVDEGVEHFVLFLQGVQHGPDFVELGPRDGGVQRFARRLFQIQRDQDVAGRLVRCVPHRSADGLHDVHLAPLGSQEGDHVHGRHVDPFRQAARVRHDRLPSRFELGHQVHAIIT